MEQLVMSGKVPSMAVHVGIAGEDGTDDGLGCAERRGAVGCDAGVLGALVAAEGVRASVRLRQCP
jgi:hypothetical protein